VADYTGTAADDVLLGGNEDDTFVGGAGNDTLTGGGGNDVAIYSGNLADYTFGYNGGFIVQDTNPGNGDDGTDTLNGIETLQFADDSITVQPFEFQVNTWTISTQQQKPDIAALADGGFVVTWQSNQDGSGSGIYAQRYDMNGAAVGGEFRVNTTTIAGQNDPAITALVNGGFVVTWQSGGNGDNGIFAQRYDTSGAAVGGEFRVNPAAEQDSYYPVITALESGGFVVAWESILAGNIFTQSYDMNGNPAGDPFRFNLTTEFNAEDVAITTLVNGDIVMSWDSFDGASGGVYARKYGAPPGGEINVNTYKTGDQSNSSITTLADGGFVVSWQSDNQDGSDYGIYAQRYNSSRAAVGGEFQVNTFTTGDQINPDVAALTDGSFVVTWQSNNQDGSGWGIYAQRYNAIGTALGTEFLVNKYTTSDQTNSAVSALTGGGFVVTWQSKDQDGAGTGIYAQRYDAEGNPVSLKLTGDTNDNIILWYDNENVTLDGGSGNDQYVVNISGALVTENNGAGTDTVQSSVSYTLSSNIENLILTGSSDINGTGNSLNNTIFGNSGDNILDGGGGSDTLYGGAGNDTLIGDGGADTYIIDDSVDIIIEFFTGGIDTVESSISYILSDNLENLLLTGSENIDGTGNNRNNLITGNSGNNTLTGNSGNDTLYGGGGNDILIGGSGMDHLYAGTGMNTLRGGEEIDYYHLESATNILIEELNQGIDTVFTPFSHVLEPNIENLILTGTDNTNGMGNSLDNSIIGNEGINILAGQDGNDQLYGYGGSNTLIGGQGNDTYYSESSLDTLIENAGQGIDQVYTNYNHVLGDNFENLGLLAGTVGIGNQLDNNISVHSSSNSHLEGMAGNDVLVGLSGNDELLGGRGQDILEGSLGDDYLDGGHDNDFMSGGMNNDTYVVNRGDGAGISRSGSNEDQVIEYANEGTDTIESYVYSLSLPANIENLILAGPYARHGFGNGLDNQITGNTNNNILKGDGGNDVLLGNGGNDQLTGDAGNDILNGGAGIDVLWGGTGADYFVFDNLGTPDWIFDFSAEDKLQLSTNTFTGIGTAGNIINSNNFISGNAIIAQDSDDHILYDTLTGRLYYDPDGNGESAMTHFATLYGSGVPILNNTSIEIIG